LGANLLKSRLRVFERSRACLGVVVSVRPIVALWLCCFRA
jgi:hypothetical protein